ncbi:LysM peptidoglycan-binding domain-containing protein [Geobacillus sp. 44B]|nr:hypothetical protein BSK33_13995 [Geobacillus sp. 44B]QNU39664.1 LysM peptidoglycan-binding domain-containing protein [Geobacillus sp. 44B]
MAANHGTTVEKLVNQNKLTYTAIHPGEKLEIPEPNTYKVVAGDTFYKSSTSESSDERSESDLSRTSSTYSG